MSSPYKEIKAAGGYFVSPAGYVYKRVHERFKPVSARPRNRKDKQLVVRLYVQKKPRRFLLARLVLSAYGGERSSLYRVKFLDGNPHNCNISNLQWSLRKNLSFFDILEDPEFTLYNQAILNIKYIHKARIQNEKWLRKFVAWDLRHPGYSRQERYRFLKQLFAVKSG